MNLFLIFASAVCFLIVAYFQIGAELQHAKARRVVTDTATLDMLRESLNGARKKSAIAYVIIVANGIWNYSLL